MPHLPRYTLHHRLHTFSLPSRNRDDDHWIAAKVRPFGAPKEFRPLLLRCSTGQGNEPASDYNVNCVFLFDLPSAAAFTLYHPLTIPQRPSTNLAWPGMMVQHSTVKQSQFTIYHIFITHKCYSFPSLLAWSSAGLGSTRETWLDLLICTSSFAWFDVLLFSLLMNTLGHRLAGHSIDYLVVFIIIFPFLPFFCVPVCFVAFWCFQWKFYICFFALSNTVNEWSRWYASGSVTRVS